MAAIATPATTGSAIRAAVIVCASPEPTGRPSRSKGATRAGRNSLVSTLQIRDDGVGSEPGRGKPPGTGHAVVQGHPGCATERQQVGHCAAGQAQQQSAAVTEPGQSRGEGDRVRYQAD